MVTERRERHALHAPPPPKTPLNQAGAGAGAKAGAEAGVRTRKLGLSRSQTVCGSLGAAIMERPEQIPAESHLRSASQSSQAD